MSASSASIVPIYLVVSMALAANWVHVQTTDFFCQLRGTAYNCAWQMGGRGGAEVVGGQMLPSLLIAKEE